MRLRRGDIAAAASPHAPASPPISCAVLSVSPLRSGIFEPHGIQPVHLDVVDGGAPFGAVTTRKVIIHDRRFSPCNCNVQLK